MTNNRTVIIGVLALVPFAAAWIHTFTEWEVAACTAQGGQF